MQGESEPEKIWLIARILESARYEDVWQYLTLQEIQGIFSKLKLKPPVRRVWAYALDVWNTPEIDGQQFHSTRSVLGKIFPHTRRTILLPDRRHS